MNAPFVRLIGAPGLAVADAGSALGQAGHLEAGILGETKRTLDPGQARTIFPDALRAQTLPRLYLLNIAEL